MTPGLRRAAVACAALFAGCGAFARPAAQEAAPVEAIGAGGDRERPSLEEEEVSLEGLGEGAAGGEDPIASLIGSLQGGAGPEAAAPASPEAAPLPSGGTAFDVWSLSDEACRALLDEAGIAVSVPGFETPFVRQPLLLDGPIDGVTIRPRWRREVRVNEVMDCRLVAALRSVAAAARAQGFSEVLFYSTYRPIRDGDRAKAGRVSMHRRGLAIDVGWLTSADGRAVSVIDDYERHPGAPPCEADADTDLGRRLRDFACALHAAKAFNVVLTPNANKAHHNHFHFDVTPDARWYIVR